MRWECALHFTYNTHMHMSMKKINCSKTFVNPTVHFSLVWLMQTFRHNFTERFMRLTVLIHGSEAQFWDLCLRVRIYSCSHKVIKLWVVTKRTASEIRFFSRFLSSQMGNCHLSVHVIECFAIQERLGVQPLLFQITKSQMTRCPWSALARTVCDTSHWIKELPHGLCLVGCVERFFV